MVQPSGPFEVLGDADKQAREVELEDALGFRKVGSHLAH
jgi:hypothetical protein